MSGPTIHDKYRTVSASKLLEALGESLSDIKREDQATDADLGAALGKGEDQAAKYRTGLAEMGAVALLRGIKQWDGRFANRAMALIGFKVEPLEPEYGSDQACITTILTLAMELSAELEKDGDVSTDDLARHRSTIERVGHVIDGYRARLKLRSVA